MAAVAAGPLRTLEHQTCSTAAFAEAVAQTRRSKISM